MQEGLTAPGWAVFPGDREPWVQWTVRVSTRVSFPFPLGTPTLCQVHLHICSMCYLDLRRRQVCVFLSQCYGRWFSELSSKIKETLNFRDLLSPAAYLVGYSQPSLSTCAAIPLALQARVSCVSKVQLNRPGEFAGIWGLHVWQSILNTLIPKNIYKELYILHLLRNMLWLTSYLLTVTLQVALMISPLLSSKIEAQRG